MCSFCIYRRDSFERAGLCEDCLNFNEAKRPNISLNRMKGARAGDISIYAIAQSCKLLNRTDIVCNVVWGVGGGGVGRLSQRRGRVGRRVACVCVCVCVCAWRRGGGRWEDGSVARAGVGGWVAGWWGWWCVWGEERRRRRRRVGVIATLEAPTFMLWVSRSYQVAYGCQSRQPRQHRRAQSCTRIMRARPRSGSCDRCGWVGACAGGLVRVRACGRARGRPALARKGGG